MVEGADSRSHMRLGAGTLSSRGSGGARLVIGDQPLAFTDQLIGLGRRLGPRLVVRSSTSLEGAGEWSGAFASYVDVSPEELPKAVVGCWASAFSVDSLRRQEATAIAPGSIAMSVLIQAAVHPQAGGTATIDADGDVVVHGVKGAPAPLLQGWVAGETARWSDGWSGPELVELVGVDTLDEIADSMRAAVSSIGANHCEWALDDELWILQLGVARQAPAPTALPFQSASQPELVQLVRTLVTSPGPLGEALILPWALAGMPAVEVIPRRVNDAPQRVRSLCEQLTAQVWGLPPARAATASKVALSSMRGPHPPLEKLRALNSPSLRVAHDLLGLIAGLRLEMTDRGVVPDPDRAWHLDLEQIEAVLGGADFKPSLRAGPGRWEPLIAAVAMAAGVSTTGTPAADGLGAGRKAAVGGPTEADRFTPRSIIASPQPVPALAPLLWEASGVVTSTGSPAAHLFDSARSLGVPAVCGVEIDAGADLVVAVDGFAGVVSCLDVSGDNHV